MRLKKILASIGIIIGCLIPGITFAAYVWSQGGTNNTGPYNSSTLIGSDGTKFVATSSPTISSITASTTSATSTFAGGLSVGADYLDILQNGKTGVNTSIPQTTLEVSSPNTTGFIISNNTGSRNVDTPALEFRAYNSPTAFGGSKILSTYSGNGTGDHFLDFFNTHLGVSTLFMRLTDLGRLGLGTSTPGTDLSLGDGGSYVNLSTSGTSTFENGINIVTGCYAIGQTCIGTGSGTVNSGVRGQATFYDANGTAVSGTTTLVFGTTTTDANNIGIGTSTPFAKLSVSKTTQSNGDLFTIASTTQANMFRVAGNGFVGIGATTSLAADLSIRTPSASFSNTAFIVKNGLVGDTSNAFVVKENGQTGIGTAPNSSYELNVGGAINSSSDVTAANGAFSIETNAGNIGTLTDTVNGLIGGTWAPDGMGNIYWNNGSVNMLDVAAGTGYTHFNDYGVGNNMWVDSGTLYIGNESVAQTLQWVTSGGSLGTAIQPTQVKVGGNGVGFGSLALWDDTDSTTFLMSAASDGAGTPTINLNSGTIPTSPAGLNPGDIWEDTTGGLNILKVK